MIIAKSKIVTSYKNKRGVKRNRTSFYTKNVVYMTTLSTWFYNILVNKNTVKDILIKLFYKVRDMYFIYRCYLDIDIYQWETHNSEIDIISPVVKFHHHCLCLGQGLKQI